MQCIRNEDGEWKETTDEIKEVIENYFSKLVKVQSLDGRLSDKEIVKMVSASDNKALLAEITP